MHDYTVQSTLNVADFYTINFDVSNNGTVYNNTVQSNMSAIVKQGLAVQSAIRHVLDKTAAEKVILVGHSMGGLASREYLQNPAIWQSDGKHHVAKLLTVGTPHAGSNQWTFGILDGYSDGVRDLRWSYSNGNAGVYLFGGNENNLAALGFHTMDVNCNGFIGDNITGLNQKNIYTNLTYACIVGTGGLSGDGVVDASRADLNAIYNIKADTFLVNAIHTDLPKQIVTNVNGFDEPTFFNQAYGIGFDSTYSGLITVQSKASTYSDDYDEYAFTLPVTSQVNIKVANIAVPQLSASIFDGTYVRKSITHTNAFSQIDTTVLLTAGRYYLEIQAQPTPYSWQFPYTFRVHSTPVTAIDAPVAQVVRDYQLLQNYPNPFNPATTIAFDLPSRALVSLKVFDLLGREVANLIHDEIEAGHHTVVWDASDCTSGTYFYRIQSGVYSETKKLTLLR